MKQLQKGALICALSFAVTAAAACMPDRIGGFTAAAEENDEHIEDENELLTYSVYADHAAVYYCNEDYTGAVTIPSVFQGKPVTVIEEYAFSDIKGITAVTVPAGVTRIEEGAFSGCTNLTDITLPESATWFGGLTFEDTPWLENQRKTDPLVIVNHVLVDAATTRGNVTLPDGLTGIGGGAFYENEALTGITIPESVSVIGRGAFCECINLKGVVIPTGVKTIEYGAFTRCPLNNVVISKSVDSIEDLAFGLSGNANIYIYNPDCKIADKEGAIQAETGYFTEHCCIHGYTGSTAEQYANKHGFTFSALDDTQTDPALLSVVSGDLDQNAVVSIEDAQLALNAYTNSMAGLNSGLTDAQKAAADVNGDNEISIEDAQLILLYYVCNTLAGIPASWNELCGKFHAEYIRIHWNSGIKPHVQKITSRRELDAYIAETNAFSAEKAAAYSEEWFSGHNLLIAVFTETSGSIKPLVTDITENTVMIEEHFPLIGSDDMAAWNILIAVDKSMKLSDQIGMTFTQVPTGAY